MTHIGTLHGPRIRYAKGDVIVLRGKTLKGKNRVREHGERWVVREVDHSVLSPNLGLLVRPEGSNNPDAYSRWVRTVGNGDPDFEIVGKAE